MEEENTTLCKRIDNYFQIDLFDTMADVQGDVKNIIKDKIQKAQTRIINELKGITTPETDYTLTTSDIDRKTAIDIVDRIFLEEIGATLTQEECKEGAL